MRRRIMSLALIALVVPFPAVALDGGGVDASSGPGSLNVSASLAGCGLAGSQIMCQINAGWSSLEGAENYTVSVTSADGSVMDLGSVSGQGTSVWVPYVGSGTYSVHVTAWGTPPDEEEDGSSEVLARSSSDGEVGVAKEPPEVSEKSENRSAEDEGAVSEDPAPVDDDVSVEPRDVTPVCEEPTVEEPPLPPAPETEPSRGDARAETLDEPEVVDTIPVDDDCSS